MNFVVNQFDRVRRRWYVVIAVALVFVIGAAVSTMGQPTTYSAKAALSASSPGSENSPYALSLAYIYLFNDPAFQDALLRKAKVPSGVSAVAEPATVGTIFFIDATGSTAKDATSAATALAGVFRDEINGALADARQQTVDAVQRPFLDRFAQRLEVPAEERVALQDQINTINANTNGTVAPVGLDSAVTQNSPARTSLLGIALVGGVLAGLIAAIAWEVASRRIRTGYDVGDKTGLAAVAVVTPAQVRSGATRRADLHHLANRLTAGSVDSGQVIAVVPAQPGARSAVHELAQAMVASLGTSDSPALLVCADATSAVARSGGDTPAGFIDALTDPTIALDDIAVPGGDGFSVIEPGNRVLDPTAAVTRSRVSTFLDAARKSAEVVVLETPILTESPEGQIICAQADQVVMVIDPTTAVVAEVRGSRRLLADVHAQVDLAVLMAPRPMGSTDTGVVAGALAPTVTPTGLTVTTSPIAETETGLERDVDADPAEQAVDPVTQAQSTPPVSLVKQS